MYQKPWHTRQTSISCNPQNQEGLNPSSNVALGQCEMQRVHEHVYINTVCMDWISWEKIKLHVWLMLHNTSYLQITHITTGH